MATTPEGLVKDQVKSLLHKYLVLPASKAGAFPETARGWYFMPVQTGYGVKVLDFIGAYCGGNRTEAAFFSIETKAKGKKPTTNQVLQIEVMTQVKCKVFVIDGDLSELEAWLRAQ